MACSFKNVCSKIKNLPFAYLALCYIAVGIAFPIASNFHFYKQGVIDSFPLDWELPLVILCSLLGLISCIDPYGIMQTLALMSHFGIIYFKVDQGWEVYYPGSIQGNIPAKLVIFAYPFTFILAFVHSIMLMKKEAPSLQDKENPNNEDTKLSEKTSSEGCQNCHYFIV